jgi:hypothetical protein
MRSVLLVDDETGERVMFTDYIVVGTPAVAREGANRTEVMMAWEMHAPSIVVLRIAAAAISIALAAIQKYCGYEGLIDVNETTIDVLPEEE